MGSRGVSRWVGVLALLALAGLAGTLRPPTWPAAGGGRPDLTPALLVAEDLAAVAAGWEAAADDCGGAACRRGPLRCQFDVSNLCVFDASAGSGVSLCRPPPGMAAREPLAGAQALFRQPARGLTLVQVVAAFEPDAAAEELACVRALLDAAGTIRVTPLAVGALGEETVAVRVAVERGPRAGLVGPCDVVAVRRAAYVMTLELCGRDTDPSNVDAALIQQLARRAADRLGSLPPWPP